ncbi:MAG: hypoxanthine phosphoribosyltransferase [Ruminococcus sp.]|nr:hypoxanthine phosphoribosyltransferase [Ruminococcus sp.]
MDTISDYSLHIKNIIITEQEIKEAVARTGKLIDEMYDGTPILLVSILKGAFIFLADLARAVTVPCEIAFMAAKSYYSGTESTENVSVTLDIDRDISGYNVIIVEDIIDTGRTLKKIAEMLRQRDPFSLKIITLLDKPSRRAVDFSADISLFTIDDLFVIGYGLDLDEKFRNLPYIAEYQE